MGILQEFKSISTGKKHKEKQKLKKAKKSFRQYCNMINSDFLKRESISRYCL